MASSPNEYVKMLVGGNVDVPSIRSLLSRTALTPKSPSWASPSVKNSTVEMQFVWIAFSWSLTMVFRSVLRAPSIPSWYLVLCPIALICCTHAMAEARLVSVARTKVDFQDEEEALNRTKLKKSD